MYFGVTILPNFGLGISGHFFLKSLTYKNWWNLHVIMAFQQ